MMTQSQRREAYRRHLAHWATYVGYIDRRPVAWVYGLTAADVADIDAEYRSVATSAYVLRLVRPGEQREGTA